MRKILFRGKTILENEWVIGAGVYKSEGHTWIITDDVTKTENRGTGSDAINPETAGQYTGLTDKNGNKIFEGDICSKFSNYAGKKFYFPIVFEEGLFFAKYSERAGMPLCDICEKIEIIGNIHDNPELLKGGEG